MITFEIFKDKKKEFRSRIRAKNGRIIFDSAEGYKRHADAMRGIQALLGLCTWALSTASAIPYHLIDHTKPPLHRPRQKGLTP